MSHARCLAAIWAVTSSVVPLELAAQVAGVDAAADTVVQEPIAAFSNPVPAARPTGRPTVGLALSGGGARGGAHIGVLRALRDLRVPIDYIAGTSIGSVIGGFYASGLDEEQLQAIADEADWNDLFDDAPSRDDRTFHRKRDDELFLVKQQAGLNKGTFGLPMGLVQGQDMDVFLARVMLPVAHVQRFDELPIPFRAVAVDMATGETVVLQSGSLGQAIRASLSVPAAIAPVNIDGRLLADGGVVQNLPVETVRDMGADVVIAVDISTPLVPRDELTSLIALTGQLVGFLTARGTADQIEKLTEHDVLITPRVGHIRSMEFARIGETYAIGYDATMAAAEQLRPFALPPEDYAAHRAGRPNPRIETPPRIDFVRLDNESTVADNIIEARLESIPTGVPLDVDAAERAVARVYGLELFEHVSYGVVERDDVTGLEVAVEERAWGPNYLQFGLESSSAGSDETMFGVSASYLRTAMNRLGAEWRTTLELGDEPSLAMTWHQPFGWNAMTFASAGLLRASSLVNVYESGVQVGRVRQEEALLDVALGREFGTWGELRFGVLRGIDEPALQTGDPAAIPLEDFDRGEAFARFTVDTLDSIYFPSGGTMLHAEWRTSQHDLDATAEFDQFSGDFVTAHTFGRHTLAFGLRYGRTTQGIAPPSSLFEMGGFWDLSGYVQDELSGQNVGGLLGSYYRRIGNLGRRMPIYAGLTLEKGNVWETRSEISLADTISAGSLWLGADTPIGPLYVAYGRAEGDRDSFYIVIGNVVN